MKTEIMMIAAEASSAHYALKLMRYWQAQKKDFTFFGVGSDDMEKAGFERIGKAEEMAVVGIAEVVEHYSELKAIFNRLVEEALRRKPKVLILMDYPDFNLMLAKKLKDSGIKIVYYISPQVWAWRQGRIKKIKKYCAKVFLLFPFEVEFYEKHGVPCEFVGHPLLDDLSDELFDERARQLYREKYGIKPHEKVLALMPGSRNGELDRHFSIQLEVARRLVQKFPHVRIAVLAAPGVEKENLLDRMEDFRTPYLMLKDDPNKMISLADLVLVASGTATLMVGLLEKPMVIMYRLSTPTYLIAKLLVRGVRFFGLANLVLGEEAVPERLQSQASPDELFQLLSRYLEDAKYYADTVNKLRQIRHKLGDKGATVRVAKGVEAFL